MAFFSLEKKMQEMRNREQEIMTDAILQLREVSKSFAGLQVCDQVTLSLERGELHALIGPNGAGKTTLLNLVTGLLSMDGGSLWFQGKDLTRKPLHYRAGAGMARSFQITSLFQGFTVRENISLAVQSIQGSSYRFWKAAARDTALREPTDRIMLRMGLADRAHILAANLAHGEQRLLEIGMALATEQDLLLLDEPMAGLGPGSSRQLAELIQSLKGEITILLVEHDMQAVFSLADRLTVLVQGQVTATGSPEAIRNNLAVQEAYLGTSC
jgi:branched-chain amino acid transport system ATP-binding protein